MFCEGGRGKGLLSGGGALVRGAYVWGLMSYTLLHTSDASDINRPIEIASLVVFAISEIANELVN